MGSDASRLTFDVWRGSIPQSGRIAHHEIHTCMKTWIAILFTLGLFVACVFLSALIRFNIVWFMVLGTSIWAAVDSSKIQLKRYKSGISYGQFGLFIGCLLIWIVGFPWYLAMRYKIKTGTAVLKDEPAKVAGGPVA
jgi:hypothetical protein